MTKKKKKTSRKASGRSLALQAAPAVPFFERFVEHLRPRSFEGFLSYFRRTALDIYFSVNLFGLNMVVTPFNWVFSMRHGSIWIGPVGFFLAF